MFKSITIANWQQFQTVALEFHKRLTVLTGANGSGKTTILNILSRHFGWSVPFVSVPKRTKGGLLQYLAAIWDHITGKTSPQHQQQVEIGAIEYADGGTSKLTVPSTVSPHYNVNLEPGRQIKGLHIPSHRPLFVYQAVDKIPTTLMTRQQSFSNYAGMYRNRVMGSGHDSPSHALKESLISLVTFGYGNQVVTRNQEAIETFEGFESVLSKVLPPSLGYRKLRVEVPEVLLETKSGDFSLDAVSGGIAALMDLSWQVFMCAHGNEPFVVMIDEPESHLHPSLQQSVIPSFLDAFPSCQFIVATHNPFIVSSVPTSHVYALDYNEQRRVICRELDMVNKAGSSNDILRDVLGLPSALPLWVERRIEDIASRHLAGGLNKESFKAMREEMTKLGFERLFPQALTDAIEGAEADD